MQEALVDFFTTASVPGDRVGRQPNQPLITIDTIFRALDLVPTPILIGMDPATTDIRSNTAGRSLFGGGDRNLSQSAAEADRPDFQVYTEGRLVPSNELPMQRAALTGRPVQASECELRFDDGSVKYIRGRAVPVFNYRGEVRGSIGVFIEVTEEREIEKRHALMTEEVKHRAKNTLALVAAVANMTIKPKLRPDEFKDFEERLQVIARSVDVFTANVSPTQSVREVISETILCQVGRAAARVHMSGPEIAMHLKGLASLGMAIHELTTNACKYGALSVPTGTVTIRWRALDDVNVVVLDWIERGGPRVVAPSRKGFGSRLLAQVLGSPGGKTTEMSFNEAGLECRLFVSLA